MLVEEFFSLLITIVGKFHDYKNWRGEGGYFNQVFLPVQCTVSRRTDQKVVFQLWFCAGREWTLDCKLHRYLKFYNHVFFGHLQCPNLSTNNLVYKGMILFINIGDVHCTLIYRPTQLLCYRIQYLYYSIWFKLSFLRCYHPCFNFKEKDIFLASVISPIKML